MWKYTPFKILNCCWSAFTVQFISTPNPFILIYQGLMALKQTRILALISLFIYQYQYQFPETIHSLQTSKLAKQNMMHKSYLWISVSNIIFWNTKVHAVSLGTFKVHAPVKRDWSHFTLHSIKTMYIIPSQFFLNGVYYITQNKSQNVSISHRDRAFTVAIRYKYSSLKVNFVQLFLCL